MPDQIPDSLLRSKADMLRALRALGSEHFEVPAFDVVPFPLGAPALVCDPECLPVLKWPCVKDVAATGVAAALPIVVASAERLGLGLDSPIWLRTSMALTGSLEVSYPGVNYSRRSEGFGGLANALAVLGSALERPYVRWYLSHFGAEFRRGQNELIVSKAASGDFYGVAYLRGERAAIDLYDAKYSDRHIRCAETDPPRGPGSGDWSDLPNGERLRAGLLEIHRAYGQSDAVTEVEFYASQGARPAAVQFRLVPMRGVGEDALLQQWSDSRRRVIDFRRAPRDVAQLAPKLAELAGDPQAVALVRDLAFRECDAFALYLAAELVGLPAPHSVIIERDGLLPRSHFASVLCEDPGTFRVGQIKANRVPLLTDGDGVDISAHHGTRIDLAPRRSCVRDSAA
ncbi:hypothetical protein ACIGJO_21315 [Streptomyces sp. NPDC079020]|uniref:hypothetical protein n=1 Tax=Streptomyces sp. NPDC079020 TaxID=3365722 RepID=UPI0037CDA028